jgi:hypothetical protein
MGIQLKLPAKHEVVNMMSESDTKELEMINAVKKNDKAMGLLRLTCPFIQTPSARYATAIGHKARHSKHLQSWWKKQSRKMTPQTQLSKTD